MYIVSIFLCQYLFDLKKKKPIVSTITPILEMRKLRHEDVKYLPKVTYFISRRTRLRMERLFHGFFIRRVEGIRLTKYSFSIQNVYMGLPKCPEMYFLDCQFFTDQQLF